MRAGSLDRKITVLRQSSPGRDPLYNTPIPGAWEPIMSLWARKTHKSEDEEVAAGHRYAERVITLRTRWAGGIEETDRIEVDGETFEIAGIREIGRRVGLEIKASTFPKES